MEQSVTWRNWSAFALGRMPLLWLPAQDTNAELPRLTPLPFHPPCQAIDPAKGSSRKPNALRGRGCGSGAGVGITFKN